MKRLKLLYLEWDDHWKSIGGGWVDRKEIGSSCKCKSVGWLIEETKVGYLLSSMMENDDDNERLAQYQFILKGTVTKKRVLKW